MTETLLHLETVALEPSEAIEIQLKSMVKPKRKWEGSSTTAPARRTQAVGQYSKPIVCFKCSQEGHFAHGCVAGVAQQQPVSKQPMNVVTNADNSDSESNKSDQLMNTVTQTEDNTSPDKGLIPVSLSRPLLTAPFWEPLGAYL